MDLKEKIYWWQVDGTGSGSRLMAGVGIFCSSDYSTTLSQLHTLYNIEGSMTMNKDWERCGRLRS
jgi:hypothetical protein